MVAMEVLPGQFFYDALEVCTVEPKNRQKINIHIFLTILGCFQYVYVNIKRSKYLKCKVLIMHYRICELFFYDASESYKTETALVDA